MIPVWQDHHAFSIDQAVEFIFLSCCLSSSNIASRHSSISSSSSNCCSTCETQMSQKDLFIKFFFIFHPKIFRKIPITSPLNISIRVKGSIKVCYHTILMAVISVARATAWNLHFHTTFINDPLLKDNL
ncbi:hypothetical protein V1477_018782 [Vespula maculifrons]|uniref:Uncharacterized protein n=1 Tax=Vespula maculifrons TaxID=7453 RepID=A0ABD2AWC2_VESMC